MKWIGLAIVIGAVVLAALPVAAADRDADMEKKGMKGDWVLLPCPRDALARG